MRGVAACAGIGVALVERVGVQGREAFAEDPVVGAGRALENRGAGHHAEADAFALEFFKEGLDEELRAFEARRFDVGGEHRTREVDREEDFAERVKEITKGAKCDVVYDGVGKDTFPASLDCIKPHGMFVSFGNAPGPVAPFNLGLRSQQCPPSLPRPHLGPGPVVPLPPPRPFPVLAPSRRLMSPSLFSSSCSCHLFPPFLFLFRRLCFCFLPFPLACILRRSVVPAVLPLCIWLHSLARADCTRAA